MDKRMDKGMDVRLSDITTGEDHLHNTFASNITFHIIMFTRLYTNKQMEQLIWRGL